MIRITYTGERMGIPRGVLGREPLMWFDGLDPWFLCGLCKSKVPVWRRLVCIRYRVARDVALGHNRRDFVVRSYALAPLRYPPLTL